jgi:hypothetical protein
MVRNKIAFPGEVDRPLRPAPRGIDDPVGVGMVADQFARHLQRWPSRVDAGAAAREQFPQPVAFGVGPLGQRAQIHLHPLRPAHQCGQGRPAQGRVGITGRGLAGDGRDEPLMCRPGRFGDGVRGAGRDAGR